MSFGISLKGEVLKEFDETVLRGEVEIDGYKESFFAPVGYWSKDDYLRSWKQSLAEGLQNGRHSALLTSMRDSEVSKVRCQTTFFFRPGYDLRENVV